MSSCVVYVAMSFYYVCDTQRRLARFLPLKFSSKKPSNDSSSFENALPSLRHSIRGSRKTKERRVFASTRCCVADERLRDRVNGSSCIITVVRTTRVSLVEGLEHSKEPRDLLLCVYCLMFTSERSNGNIQPTA